MRSSRRSIRLGALAVSTLASLALVVSACASQPASQPTTPPTQAAKPAATQPAPTAAPKATEPSKPAGEATKPAAQPTAGAKPSGAVKPGQLDPKNLPSGWTLPKAIGHVTNYLVHEWYQNETKWEANRAREYGIEFSINDANLDLQKSLAAVDDYLAKNVDALVFTPVNEQASGPTIKRAAERVPVVCEGSPTDGCYTLVSIDDYSAGVKVGKWAGEYVKQHLGGKAKVLDIGLPALSTTVARSKGFIDGLKSVVQDVQVVSVDGKGLKDEAVKVAADALTANPDVNVIFGINDDSALGGLQSFRAANLDESKLLVVGFGCEGKACKSALMEGGPYKVSAAMFPEYQGRMLIDAAVMAFNKQQLPQHTIAPTLAMTKELLTQYYTQQGEEWIPNFDAIARISTEGER
ncbi:MAG TPA: sugar ABC transporter substrate-binding protein [Chloroflexota bacterium]